MHGGQMSEGDSVLLLIGAANHDEREFGPTAEEFDIHRRPERHLAFRLWAHFCLVRRWPGSRGGWRSRRSTDVCRLRGRP
jgi:hypothetical protein